MNEELVKELRNRRICIQRFGSLENFPLLREAADIIETLSAFRERMDHIKAIQYISHYGGGLDFERVAYFDDRNTTEEKVRSLLSIDFYDPRITIMTRQQAELVFGYKWQEEDADVQKEV